MSIVSSCRAFALIAVAIVPATAHGDGARLLAEAERALDGLDYPAAAAALEEALDAGDNGPQATARIHLLSGIVAGSFGRGDDAQAAFANALAIDPTLALGPGYAPRIATPFARAQAQLEDGGSYLAITCHTEGVTDAAAAILDISSDPTALVAGVSARYRGEDGTWQTESGRGSVDPRVDLATIPDGRIRIAAIDAHGNELTSPCWADPPPRLTPIPPATRIEPVDAHGSAVVPMPSTVDETRGTTPLYRRWEVWATGAGAATATAALFGLRARAARSELDDILANSDEHTYSEAKAVEERGERNMTRMGISLVVAGGAAATAVALWLFESDDDPRADSDVTIHAGASGAAIGWSTRF